MVGESASADAVAPFLESQALRRLLSGITQRGVAVLDRPEGPLKLATYLAAPPALTDSCLDSAVSGPNDEAGLFHDIALTGEEAAALAASAAGAGHPAGHRWRGFACAIRGGLEDRVALELAPDIDARLVRSFLDTIWPVLREDCFAELHRSATADDAETLLWTVLDRLDVAVMILDGKGLMYRVNAAGGRMLEDGSILKRGRGGVFAASDEESRLFRAAVARCAEGGEAATVFLTHKETGRRRPLSISRYMHEGEATRFVVVTVPQPPDPARIEALARQLGLTRAEARVAQLMQLGLSNRNAAKIAGVSEATFATYAKRALSKLDVQGRAEMAQLLTWQATVGRLS